MSSLGATIPLPPSAVPGEAFQQTVFVPAVFVSQAITFKLTGDYYVQLLTVSTQVTTSAAAGTRAAGLWIKTADGAFVAAMPASTTQGPGVGFVYTWSTSVGAGVSNATDTFAMPLMTALLFPTWTISFVFEGIQAGDAAQPLALTGVWVPSGGGQSDVAPLVTPVLV